MDRPVVLLDMACSMTLGLGLSYNLVGRPTAYEPSVLRCDANTCTHLKQPWDNLHVSLCLGYVLAMVFPYHARACFVADTTHCPSIMPDISGTTSSADLTQDEASNAE